MNQTTTRGVAGVALLALLAGACSSDDDAEPAPEPEASEPEADEPAADDATGSSGCEVGEVDGDLALYNWAEYIEPEHLDAFAEEFGIGATMDVYDSNEAMLPVIAAGNSGYDVIVPSDYMVGIMIDGGFLAPLDFAAIPNATNISPDFASPSYDPELAYSVPYQWGFTGISVDTQVVGADFPRSWDIVFGDFADDYSGQITLLNDPRETLGAALKANGNSLNSTSQEELDAARDLVADARGNLLAFNTDSSDELLTSGESAIAHTYSGDAFTQFLETDDPSRYVFFVPEEGGTRWIDNMAVPFDAPHPCTAHTFINWLLDGDEGAALSNWNYYGTPNAASIDLLDEELNEFLTSPDVLVGGIDTVEEIADTGDFEINYSDAFTEAKG